ncbi:hypothetical protein C7271_12720 [filamentous cyanobacterium CCP5]|nr:hypothetical protein C7271_12720 [filamentous cyanobacterium CCP5]
MSDFTPGQIVYLEHQGDRLYGEIIQVVRQRQMIWLRPLVITIPKDPQSERVDLSDTADLLWPMHRLRAALDVDALPILADLPAKRLSSTAEPGDRRLRTKQLSQFIERAWRG